MGAMLPCPVCSNVIHDGALSRAEAVVPGWLFAKMTSAKHGCDHFTWLGCSHAAPIGPPMPTDVRETTEARWNVEARRLFELRTANWAAPAREKFGQLLGFTAKTDENR